MKKIITLLLLCITSYAVQAAPVTGAVAVPSVGYATFSDVIDSLNLNGVGAGGATITFVGTETAPAGGYKLGTAVLNASTSAANPLVFVGTAGTLTSFTGVNATTDIVWDIAGTDFVTINGFTILEAPTNTTALTRMEYGIRLSLLSTTDGCKDVEIANNQINLDASTNTGVNEDNQCGIGVMSILSTNNSSKTTTTIPASALGDHENIRVTGNTIVQAYNGIYVRSATSTTRGIRNVVVNNNIIQNFGTQIGTDAGFAYGIYVYYVDFDIEVNENTIAQPNLFDGGGYGIYVYSHQGSTANTVEINRNDVSMTERATRTISDSHYGIYYTNNFVSSGVVAHIDSNNIHDFVYATADATSGVFYGIYTFGSYCSLKTINANTVNTITKNSGTTYGIYTSMSDFRVGNSEIIDDNKVSNINHIGSTGTNSIRGMYVAGDAQRLMHRDTVDGITMSGTGTSAFQYLIGIQDYSYGAPLTGHVSEDMRVCNLTSNQTRGNVTGYHRFNSITNTSGGTNVMNRINVSNLTNNVSVITASTTSGFYSGLSGITLEASCYPQILKNSFVSGLSAPNMVTNTTNFAVWGIRSMWEDNDAGGGYKIYNNTIALGQAAPLTSTGATFAVYGIGLTNQGGGIATADIRNNIINVKATPNGTGFVAALNEQTAGTMLPTSNNNIYYAPNAAGSFLYSDNGSVNSRNLGNDPNFNTSCGIYKGFKAPAEGATFTEDNLVAGPLPKTFVPSGASFAQGLAQPLADVPMDYAMTPRAAAPDRGALEFTGPSSGDIIPPTVAYTDVDDMICIAEPTLDVTITDASGIGSGAVAPRLYYRKSTEANAFVGNTAADNGWKWINATNTASPYSFAFDFSLLNSAVATGDIIEYFVVAQDSAAPANITTASATYPAAYCPASVDVTGVGSTPITGAKTFTILNPILTATPGAAPMGDTICIGMDAMLSVTSTTALTDTALDLQWQSSPAGAATWTNIAGATTTSYTDIAPAMSMDYQLLATCPAPQGLIATSSTASYEVVNPIPTAITGAGSSCTPDSFMYSVTPAAGSNISWYTDSTSVTPVDTGAMYTTPLLTMTDTMWVSGSVGGSIVDSADLPVTGGGFANRGSWFVAQSNFTMTECFVPTSTSATGAWQTFAILKMNTATTPPTGTGYTVLHYEYNNNATGYIPVNIPIVTGDVIVVAMGRATTATATTSSTPYVGTNTGITVDGLSTTWQRVTFAGNINQNATTFSSTPTGSTSNTAGAFEFNYEVSSICESERIPVISSVYTRDTITSITATPDTICAGTDAVLQIMPAQAVDTNTYCADAASSLADTKIDTVSFAGITTGTAPLNAGENYTDNTSVVIPVTAGMTYPLAVAKGDNNGPATFAAWCKVLIDYNQDGDFADAGEEVYSFGAPAAVGSIPATTVAIPATAMNGLTTMRVILREGGVAANTGDCNGFTWGETEDYTILIGGGVENTAGGIGSYTWTPTADLDMATGDSVTALALTTTTMFTAIGTDLNGCMDTAMVTVTVNPAPAIMASAADTVLCLGDTTTLTATGADTYMWNPGALMGDMQMVSPMATTTYVVIGTDTTTACDWSDSVTVMVLEPFYVAATGTVLPGTCAGDTVTLMAMDSIPPLAPYCASNATFTGDTHIDSTNINGTITAPLPLTTGGTYTDNTAITIPVTAGTAFPISITKGLTGTNSYSAWAKVYIDLDQNGVFDLPGEEFTSAAAGGFGSGRFTVTGNITIPVTALDGPTTMRIVMEETGAAANVEPCGTYGYGETEDYTVVISGGVPPIAYTWTWNPGALMGAMQTILPPVTDSTYIVTQTHPTTGCTAMDTVMVNPASASGDLTQAMANNTASMAGTSCDTLTQPNDGSSNSYYDASCNIIAGVTEPAGGASLGNVSVCANVDPSVQSYNGQPYVRRWFDINPDTNGPADVTLYFTDEDFSTYNAGSGAFDTIATNAGGATTTQICITQVSGGPLGTGTPTVHGPLTATWDSVNMRWDVTFPVTGFSEFYCHPCNALNSALSADYKSYTVTKQATSDLVEWTTVSEENSKLFNVQRSANGQNFETIGTVNSQAINGNSNEELNYSFVDENPQVGHNYYMLEQVDFDNNTSYTKAIDIIWGANGSTVSIYPNPAKSILNIDLSAAKASQTEIKLVDMSGRVVKSVLTQSEKGLNHVTIDLSDISVGIYGVQVFENNKLTHVSKVRKN